MRNFIIGLTAAVMLLCSCANKAPADRPHATVSMRDGTQVSGKVMSSSASEITIAGDDNITRTIPMNQVRAVEYDDPATAQSAPPAGAAQPGQAAAPSGAAPAASPARRASRAPVRDTDSGAGQESHYHPDQSAIQTKTYELPVGSEVSVRTEETIDSGKAAEGQTYAAEVTKNVVDSDGAVVIPRGANAKIVIRSASKGGRIRGASDLVLDLASVSIGGQAYEISTTDVAQRGKSGVGINKRTAEYTGGGAALGAIIGAIAGQGKGAAIGAGAGAGAGALTQILTKGGSIKVPVESVLTFRLDKPLRVVAAR